MNNQFNRNRSYRVATLSRCVVGALLTALLANCATADVPTSPAQIAVTRPHDRGAFTEGLLFADGRLYESTGQYGASELRRINPVDGTIDARRPLAPFLFGEGLARHGDRFYQLTWKAGVARVYDRHSLQPTGWRHYQGQGWGLTTCGNALVMSNGSDTLTFRRPDDFTVVRRLRVTADGHAVSQLNELEQIHGRIWANQWQHDRILVIDAANGHVVHIIDASALAARQPGDADVLNGIAYDARADRVYITGKYWPALYGLANGTRYPASGASPSPCAPQ